MQMLVNAIIDVVNQINNKESMQGLINWLTVEEENNRIVFNETETDKLEPVFIEAKARIDKL